MNADEYNALTGPLKETPPREYDSETGSTRVWGSLRVVSDDEAPAWLIARGRWIVETGATWSTQADARAIRAYHRGQREYFETYGNCAGGCQPGDQIRANGNWICYRTRRRCDRIFLNAILERWQTMGTVTKTETPKRGELIPQAERNQLIAIEQLRETTKTELAAAEAAGQDVLKGLVVARAMRQLRELLDDTVMADVLALMNSPLGFLTDKQSTPYDLDTVRDCAITALLQGFSITGNEWNIIGGRFYAALEGVKRRVQQWPEIANLSIDLGVPQMVGDKGALVEARARWTIGQRVYVMTWTGPNDQDPVDTRLAVRVNAGMGADAILGKARRKIYARILERLTGITDDDVGDVVEASAYTQTPPAIDPGSPRPLLGTPPLTLDHVAAGVDADGNKPTSALVVDRLSYEIERAETDAQISYLVKILERVEARDNAPAAAVAVLREALRDRAEIVNG